MTFPLPVENLPASHEWFDEIIGLRERADEYIQGFEWCGEIQSRTIYYSLGKVLTVFLYNAADLEADEDTDNWIIVGDLPSAGLNVVDDDSLVGALGRYADYAEEWAECAVDGDLETECYPFDEDRTPELGRMLSTRVEFIRNQVIPNIADVEL